MIAMARQMLDLLPVSLRLRGETMQDMLEKFLTASVLFMPREGWARQPFSRLYGELSPNSSLAIRVALHGWKDQELASFEFMVRFWPGRVSNEKVISRQSRRLMRGAL